MIKIGNNENLSSITAYGGCEQNGTPTPDSPIDIICNNGTLKFVSDDVPIDYLRLEYLESSGTQYIDSGISINYAAEKIEQTATLQYTKNNTNRELMGTNGYGFFGKSASNKLESAIGTTSIQITESALNKNTVSLITNPSDKSVIFNINSNQYKASASTLADNYYTCFVFALGGRDGAAASFFCNVKVYDYKITLNDEVVLHLVPVKRRSDGMLGMYDIVNNIFKTNAGTGTFIAGVVIGHVETIGTPEVITVSGGTSTETASVENLFAVGDYEDEQEIISGTVTRKCGIKVLNGTEEWTTDIYGGSRRFVNYNFAKQELSTVLCTHFSSTADDGARISPGNAYVAATGALVIYKAESQSIDTVADWKSFLSAQYAAGTPVIVVYLLAQETTEQVTAQPVTGTMA